LLLNYCITMARLIGAPLLLYLAGDYYYLLMGSHGIPANVLLLGMMQYTLSFPGGEVEYNFELPLADMMQRYPSADCVLVTDSNIAALYAHIFKGYRTIIIPAGEKHKTWQTAANAVNDLLLHQAHRKTTLIGIGGGMITDITGFVAAVYMRGVNCVYVPTSLLAMADAAIGGKNGVNTGLHKNIIGTVRQPSLILFDTTFLATLPDLEWSNGFAEIIKYACLFDAALFEELNSNDLSAYKSDAALLSSLIVRCVDMKNKVVLRDELETGDRKLLNFGHTAGHPLEQLYNLPHGYAVALGMMIACKLSETVAGLSPAVTAALSQLLIKYKLPVDMDFEAGRVMELLMMDKKRSNTNIDYILLRDIGQPQITQLSFDVIYHTLAT